MKNFQRAISYCSGDYLVFCDQDDIWLPDKIAIQLDHLRASNALALFSDAFLVDAHGKDLNIGLLSPLTKKSLLDVIDSRAFYLTNCVTGCTLMIRRQLLESALPFPESLPYDWWLGYHAVYSGRLTFMGEKLIHYRQHGGNVFGVRSKIRNKRLSFYIRFKIEALNLVKRLKCIVQDAFLAQYRLKAMYNFEITQAKGPSEELIHLNRWISDKILGKDLSNHQAFFQSDSPVFQFLEGKKPKLESLDSVMKRAIYRCLRRMFRFFPL